MKIQVLDHGYVELIECWGSGKDGVDIPANDGLVPEAYHDDFEVGVIEAARQSTQGSFRGWESRDCTCSLKDRSPREWRELAHEAGCPWKTGDKHLLRFLYEHHHSTPFEFSGMVIEVQAPIFVFREWHRHRTQSYNEASARYAALPDLYYHADRANVWTRAMAAKQTTNKQLSSTSIEDLNPAAIEEWQDEDDQLSLVLEAHYRKGLAIGIPKELARKKMPVDHYSKMRASANLRNWLAFLALRLDPAAQWEIRQFANAVAQLVAARFPRTWELFDEQLKAQS